MGDSTFSILPGGYKVRLAGPRAGLEEREVAPVAWEVRGPVLLLRRKSEVKTYRWLEEMEAKATLLHESLFPPTQQRDGPFAYTVERGGRSRCQKQEPSEGCSSAAAYCSTPYILMVAVVNWTSGRRVLTETDNFAAFLTELCGPDEECHALADVLARLGASASASRHLLRFAGGADRRPVAHLHSLAKWYRQRGAQPVPAAMRVVAAFIFSEAVGAVDRSVLRYVRRTPPPTFAQREKDQQTKRILLSQACGRKDPCSTAKAIAHYQNLCGPSVREMGYRPKTGDAVQGEFVRRYLWKVRKTFGGRPVDLSVSYDASRVSREETVLFRCWVPRESTAVVALQQVNSKMRLSLPPLLSRPSLI